MEEAIRFAKQYIENVLSFFGMNTDVYATHEDEVICLKVPSTHLNGFLIGQNGDTMRSMQYLVSMSLKANGYDYTRVSVDIADYKAQHQERIAAQADDWIAEVKKSGKIKELKPMSAADRRIVHKQAVEAGLVTESIGEGRERHVLIKPAPEEA